MSESRTEPATIAAVNALDRAQFRATFGHVLEDSPALADAAWSQRPFADRAALADAFARAVESLDDDDALELLRAHPELGSRGPMAAASVSEQASAGLDRATDNGHGDEDGDDVMERLRRDNVAYRERFGFPFILAVRGRTADEIAANLEQRLGHEPATERSEALRQVCQIAVLRVEQMVAAP
ncbi:MAG TPA: 2-oxo-4-hydroxy-4-carboxy-5-ureidoimidazoline decarboxylase [Acidimicrobiia bacterium]